MAILEKIISSLSSDSDMYSQTMQKKHLDNLQKEEIKKNVATVIQQFATAHKIDLKNNPYEYRGILRHVDLLTSTEIANYVKSGNVTIHYHTIDLKGNDSTITIKKTALKKDEKANITFYVDKQGPQEETY